MTMPRDFLEDFTDTSLWAKVPAKHRFQFKKDVNRGMKENHRLALTMRGVIDRSLEDSEGLQTSDFEGYQIFEKGDLAFKLIDLQNIKTSRVGLVPRRGIMSPAYVRLSPIAEGTKSEFFFWYFYAAYVGNIFNGMGGGIRQNLNQSELLEFPVPDISKSDQESIVRFLDHETARIDGLIEKKYRFLALLKEKRIKTITSAVTKGLIPEALIIRHSPSRMPFFPVCTGFACRSRLLDKLCLVLGDLSCGLIAILGSAAGLTRLFG